MSNEHLATPEPRLASIPDEIAALGPYFAFEIHDENSALDDSWRPLGQLLDGTDALASRYRQFQTALASPSGRPVEFRVAASTGHLAFVSRLVCVAFGAALLGHRLDLRGARWQGVMGGVMPLSFPAGAIGALSEIGDISDLMTGPVRTLTELTVQMSISPKVLWGNVSSAVNGAVMAACGSRPELADRAIALGRALGTMAGPDFRRSSCCLIYRIAESAPAPTATTASSWAAITRLRRVNSSHVRGASVIHSDQQARTAVNVK